MSEERKVTKVTTGTVRFSYLHVFEPWAAQEGQEKRYSVCLLIPKSDKKTLSKIKEAIEAAKKGKRIARKGWNGKGQYVELAKAISYKSPTGAVVNAEHDAIGNQALAFVGTSGVQMGWLASQADMLADDWEIVEG